jgi:hypothetical protein
MRTLVSIRRLVKKTFVLCISYYLMDDLLCRLRLAEGNIDTDSGMAHRHGNLQNSIKYIEEVFADYRTYAGVEVFHGRVAEVGPGDSSGVAMLFIADGCQSVDLVDRFYSKRDPEFHASVHRALIARHRNLSERLGMVAVTGECDSEPVVRHYGPSAAAEKYFDNHQGYDFIVSRAVLEHVYDPILALRRMVLALNQEGMLLHKVDLRDHGMFSSCHHELKYFEVHDALYPLITRGSGRPNRVLVNRYREALIGMQVPYRILVTRLAGVGDIVPHLPYEEIDSALRVKSLAYVRSVRGRFARSLQNLSDEDLSVSGFFLIAKRAPA